MPTATLEPKQIQHFAVVARRQLTAGSTRTGEETPTAGAMAEAVAFGGVYKYEGVPCEASQLNLCRVPMPIMRGRVPRLGARYAGHLPAMHGEVTVTLSATQGSHFTFIVSRPRERRWWKWFNCTEVNTEIEFSLPPAAEAKTLEKAELLVGEGKTQDGINLVYDEIDNSLHTKGPEPLNDLLATFEPEKVSAPVLLALITVSRMAGGQLSNWKPFLEKLATAEMVKSTPALWKAVTRSLGQLKANGAQPVE